MVDTRPLDFWLTVWGAADFSLLNYVVSVKALLWATYGPMGAALVVFWFYHEFRDTSRGLVFALFTTPRFEHAATRPERLNYQWLVYANVAALVASLLVVLNALNHYAAWGEALIFGHHYQQTFLALWFVSGKLFCFWGGWYDWVTLSMMFVVFGVSIAVHLFSVDYMRNDPGFMRFYFYLSLFTFFMLILVTAPTLVQLFVGWEGVGLCSYLLISFWLSRIAAVRCAVKAVIVNKIGDCALLVGLALLYHLFGSVANEILLYAPVERYQTAVRSAGLFLWSDPVDPLFLILVLLFIGVMAKSAQLGLHTWLPDAMEGPTPVSALIHAATMVTAGVFLLIRYAPLFSAASPYLLMAVSAVGVLTLLVAGCAALIQADIKKVIAYSTCSQLGYMVLACGQGSFAFALYHLTTHAFYKALLFLSAGVVIHFVGDEQDVRRLRSLWTQIPLVYFLFCFASASLAGYPFFGGFYSKEAIIDAAYWGYALGAPGGAAIYVGSVVGVLLTALYSARLLTLVFTTPPIWLAWNRIKTPAPAREYLAGTTYASLLLLGAAVVATSSAALFTTFSRLNFYPVLRVNAALSLYGGEQQLVFLQRKAATLGLHPPAFFSLLPLLLAFGAAVFVRYYYEFEHPQSRKGAPPVVTKSPVAVTPARTEARVTSLQIGAAVRGFDEFGRIWGLLFYAAGYSTVRYFEAGWLSWLGPVGVGRVFWWSYRFVVAAFPLRIGWYGSYWVFILFIFAGLWALLTKIR